MNSKITEFVRIAIWGSCWLLAVGSSNAQVDLESRRVAKASSIPSNKSTENMVASVHPLATAAGLRAFEKGGNAIDAAVATALMLGVVDSFNSGIGGGCFVLIRTADGALIAIDGREMAPAAAERDMYLRNGVADPQLSQTGPLASGVPGALAAYFESASQFGKLQFSDLILPAAETAAQGFAISEGYEARLKSEQTALARFPGSAAIFLKADGTVFSTGELLIQTDLANTYRQIAKHGPSWFYNGPFATATEAWNAKNDGILTARDFANYQTVRRQPIRTTYRGFEVIGFPPPSSGGVHVAQILNILENFDLSALAQDDPAIFKHVVAEAMKQAFADRAFWLGDPDFVNVPIGLIDKKYAKTMADRIDIKRVTAIDSHGIPPAADAKFFEKHTTHIAAADRAGNWVAITTTLNTSFGSKVVVPGLGVMMNNQMDDFSIAPGIPNAYGLVGGENNAVTAGKRPLSSMSPTIVLKDGVPVLTVGAAGGPQIISQVLGTILQHLDAGLPIEKAVAAPRLHHQWSPDRLLVESTTEDAICKKLTSLGHVVEKSPAVGITQAIAWDPATGLFTGVADPRTTGRAAGQAKELMPEHVR